MKRILLLILIPVLLSFQSVPNKVRVYIAGDSTAQSYDTTKTLQRGWGQFLSLYFNDKVEVVNKAKAGRSTKSFQDEGRWAEIVSNIRKGDWVIIQFGHNDTSNKPERHGYGPVIWAGAEMIKLLNSQYPRMNDSAVQYYTTPQNTTSPIFSADANVGRPETIIAGSSRKTENAPVIFVIGDSTAKNGQGKGDGDMIQTILIQFPRIISLLY